MKEINLHFVVETANEGEVFWAFLQSILDELSVLGELNHQTHGKFVMAFRGSIPEQLDQGFSRFVVFAPFLGWAFSFKHEHKTSRNNIELVGW